MPFATRYSTSFKDITGVTVQVDIEEDTFVGGTTTIPLRGPSPLIRSDGSSGGDLFDPFRPSTVEAALRASGSSILSAIFTSDNDWRLKVTKDSVVHFYGPIIEDAFGQSLDSYGGDYRVSAICGLGRLKKLKVYDELTADAIAEGDNKTVAGWIIYFLDKIGLGIDVYTATRSFAYGMSAGDPLTQEYLNPRLWLKDADRNKTVWDALGDVLRPHGLFVHQRDGAWRVFNRRLFYASSFTQYQYASGSAATTSGASSTWTAHETITDPPGTRIAGGQMPMRRANGETVIKYAHGTIDNLIPNANWRPPSRGSSEAVGWTRSGGAAFEYTRGQLVDNDGNIIVARRRVLAMPVVHAAEGTEYASILVGPKAYHNDVVDLDVTGVDNLLVKLRAEVNLTQYGEASDWTFFAWVWARMTWVGSLGTYYSKWINENGSDSVGTWETVALASMIRIEVQAGGVTDIELLMEAPPEDGTLLLELYSASDNTGIGPPLPYMMDTMYWYPPVVIPVIGDDNVEFGSIESRCQDTTSSGLARDTVEVRVGSGPTQLHAGALVTSAGVKVDDWGLDVQVSPSGYSLAEWQAYEELKQVRSNLDMIAAGYRNTEVHPMLAPAESGVPYLPVWATYDYRWARSQVEANEVRIDGFTPAFTEILDDGFASASNSTGEGGAISVAAFNDYTFKVATTDALTATSSDLTGVITSIPISPSLAEEYQAISDGEFILVAGKFGGAWVFEISGAHPAPVSSISVVSQDIGSEFIPSGSGVYPTTGTLTAIQTLTANAIYQAITSGVGFTALSADVTGVVTALPVTAIPFDLLDGWKLRIWSSRRDTIDDYGVMHIVTVDGDHSSGATSIAILSATVVAASGDAVNLHNQTIGSEILQNAALIELKVTRTEVIDDINNVVQTGAVAISAGKVDITGVTTFYNGNTLAQNINAGVTTIDGSSITTGTITADRLNVTDLNSITANTGDLTVDGTISVGASGEINIGSGDMVIESVGGITIKENATLSDITWIDASSDVIARAYGNLNTTQAQALFGAESYNSVSHTEAFASLYATSKETVPSDSAAVRLFSSAGTRYAMMRTITAGEEARVYIDTLGQVELKPGTGYKVKIAYQSGSAYTLPQTSSSSQGDLMVLGASNDLSFTTTLPATLDFQDGLFLTTGSPTATAGKFALYADAQFVPKGYIGTAGPFGLPVTLFRAYADTGTSLTATTSGNTLMTYTLPTSHLAAGQVYEVEAWGYVENTDIIANSFQFKIAIGGTVKGTAPAAFSVFVCNAGDSGYYHVRATIFVDHVTTGTAYVRASISATYTEADAGTVHEINGSTTETGLTVASAHAIVLSDDWNTTDAATFNQFFGGTIKQVY